MKTVTVTVTGIWQFVHSSFCEYVLLGACLKRKSLQKLDVITINRLSYVILQSCATKTVQLLASGMQI